jgi:hypothetical protein
MVRENKVVNLPKTGSMLRRLLIIAPLVLVLTLVSLFLPARRVTIEGIGRLSFETAVTLSVGSEVAYAAPGITYFNSASTPVDSATATNTANPTVVTPPANMQVGDLVIMTAQIRATSGTLSISQAGGQTWTTEAQTNQSNARRRLFWCRFNGIWSANPSVSMGGSTSCNSVVMHVFRPSGTSYTWAIDVAQVAATFNAPSSPYTVTIPAISTLTGGALVFASWGVSAANTWGSLTAGWEKPWSAQYRNTSGSDCSQTSAYKVQAVAGNTGAVSQNESAGTAGARLIIAFKEVAPPPDISNTPSTKDFGTVSKNSSYWSHGSIPPTTFPLYDDECFFTVTNNSSAPVNILIRATNFTSSGVGWTLASSPGVNIVTLKAGKSGDVAESNMVILTTSDQSFITGLAQSTSKQWELKLETGTFTDAAQKTSTITLTATYP